jgi:hypothetical protein
MKGEISFDLVMEENMAFVEGTFRVAGGNWQVFIFSRHPCKVLTIKPGLWNSGVSGFQVLFPALETLNKSVVKRILSDYLGITEWTEVRGPDSMQLR